MIKKICSLLCVSFCLISCSTLKENSHESVLEKVEYITANEDFTDFSVRAVFSTIGNKSDRELIVEKQIMERYDISDTLLIIVESYGKTYGQFNYKITKKLTRKD